MIGGGYEWQLEIPKNDLQDEHYFVLISIIKFWNFNSFSQKILSIETRIKVQATLSSHNYEFLDENVTVFLVIKQETIETGLNSVLPIHNAIFTWEEVYFELSKCADNLGI